MVTKNSERRMPLRDHLKEARNRLILALSGILIAAVVGWFYFEPAFEALQRPVLQAAAASDGQISINFAGVITALDMRVRVSLFLGFIASSPWWLYQLWAYVAPGLKRRERFYTAGFMAAALPLFAGGVALGWWILPRAVRILTDFIPEESTNLINAQDYLTFVMHVMVGLGITLVFPVVMVGLSWLGIVKPRTWLHGWRWAVVVILVFAALITPTPDVLSMLAMALPMCALYFLAIGIGALKRRKRRKGTS